MGEECGDTPAVNLNHCVTGGSTVHSINIEICATVPVSPEIPTSVFVISLHRINTEVKGGKIDRNLGSPPPVQTGQSDLQLLTQATRPTSQRSHLSRVNVNTEQTVSANTEHCSEHLLHLKPAVNDTGRNAFARGMQSMQMLSLSKNCIGF